MQESITSEFNFSSSDLKLLERPADLENDKVNKILYIFTAGLVKSAENPAILNYILSSLKSDKSGAGISITKLSINNSEFNEVLSKNIADQLKILNLNGYFNVGVEEPDIINALSAQLVYHGEKYDPLIYTLKNEEGLEIREQNIVFAIAEEVNDNDDVLALKKNDKNHFLLSEKMAQESTDKIIFIGNGKESDYIYNRLGTNEKELETRAVVNIVVDEHQVKNGYRYETSNTSEVRGWAVFYYPGDFAVDWNSNMNISANDINISRIFTNDLSAFSFDESDFNNGMHVFYGTNEYDWYASLKWVLNPCDGQNNHSTQVRMKFSHEWYFLECGEGSIFWPSVGSNKVSQNEKSMFKMKRN